MTGENPDRDETDAGGLTAERLFEELEPFEPYTADELAAELGSERGTIRKLLDRLRREEKVKTKQPKSSAQLWIREPPVNSCGNCGRQFEIKFLHPVLSSVQFCPRCGHQL